MVEEHQSRENESRRSRQPRDRRGTAASERGEGEAAYSSRKAEEPADLPAVVVETSSSTSATAVVAGSAGFETDRLPLKEA